MRNHQTATLHFANNSPKNQCLHAYFRVAQIKQKDAQMMEQTRKDAKLPVTRRARKFNFSLRQLLEMRAMNRTLGIALLVFGIVLIVFGMNASDSVESDFSRFFTGTPISKALWLLVSGIVSVIVGG